MREGGEEIREQGDRKQKMSLGNHKRSAMENGRVDKVGRWGQKENRFQTTFMLMNITDNDSSIFAAPILPYVHFSLTFTAFWGWY